MTTKKHDIHTEWDKIKDYDIFPTFEEFEKEFNKNPNGNCFRKYTVYPWSRDNFFFGTYEEFQNYLHTTTEIPFYLKDKIGTKIRYLTIKSFYRGDDNRLMAKCECDCGKIVGYEWKKLKDDYYRTCGCIKGTGEQKNPPKPKMSIVDLFPNAIKRYWDYKKNTEKPENVFANSQKEYWWKGYNKSFLMPISCLTTKSGGTSFPEQAIMFYLKKEGIDVKHRYKVREQSKNYEIDIYLPDYKVGIEYDGVHWHKSKITEDNIKNEAIKNANIYLIRIREAGLPPTNMVYGEEILCDIDNEDYLTAIANSITSIFDILKKYNVISISISKQNIEKDRPLILGNYLLGFEEDNINSTWLSKFWAKENGVEPYLVSLNSQERYYFKCKNGNLFVSPKIIMGNYNKLNDEQQKEFSKSLCLSNKCPFVGTPYCPSNVYYNIDRDCPKCDFITTFNQPYKKLKDMFLNEFSSKFSLEKFIFYMCEFAQYKPSNVSNLLSEYIENASETKSEKFDNIYKTIAYPNVLYEHIYKYFINPNVVKFYVESYDFSPIFTNNNMYLNLSHTQNIFNVVSGIIYSKRIVLLSNFLEVIYKKLSKNNYDYFIFSVFNQLYLKKYSRYDELIDKKGTLDKIFETLIDKTTDDTKIKIKDILQKDRDLYIYETFCQYITELKKDNKLTDVILKTLMSRVPNLSVYNKILNYCGIEMSEDLDKLYDSNFPLYMKLMTAEYNSNKDNITKNSIDNNQVNNKHTESIEKTDNLKNGIKEKNSNYNNTTDNYKRLEQNKILIDKKEAIKNSHTKLSKNINETNTAPIYSKGSLMQESQNVEPTRNHKTNTLSNCSRKTTDNKKKKSIIVTTIIAIILLLGIIVNCVPGISFGTNIKGVEYSLNDDNQSYTMQKKVGLLYIYSKAPNNIKIPEKYKDKPITNIDGFSCEHNIKSLTGSKNLETIDENAFCCKCQDTTFLGIMKLKSVIFPPDSNLKTIKYDAFFKCSNLEKIVVPKNFECFERGVFYCCVKLKSIYIYNPIPPLGATSLFDDAVYKHSAPSGLTIYVPSESVETYKQSNWRMYNIQPIRQSL